MMRQAKPTYAGWLPLHSATSMIFSSVSPTQAVGFVTGFCHVALRQGAALHYVDGSHGVKDFDVWASSGACQTCLFRLAATDGATSGARASAADYANRYEGRRVGILVDRSMFGVAAVRRYLAAGLRGSSPWYLAQRPIIAIYPDLILGRRIWSPAK